MYISVLHIAIEKLLTDFITHCTHIYFTFCNLKSHSNHGEFQEFLHDRKADEREKSDDEDGQKHFP